MWTAAILNSYKADFCAKLEPQRTSSWRNFLKIRNWEPRQLSPKLSRNQKWDRVGRRAAIKRREALPALKVATRSLRDYITIFTVAYYACPTYESAVVLFRRAHPSVSSFWQYGGSFLRRRRLESVGEGVWCFVQFFCTFQSQWECSMGQWRHRRVFSALLRKMAQKLKNSFFN